MTRTVQEMFPDVDAILVLRCRLKTLPVTFLDKQGGPTKADRVGRTIVENINFERVLSCARVAEKEER